MFGKTIIIVGLAILTVLLGTIAIYWQGLSGPFLLDDDLNIVSAYVADFNAADIYYALTHNESGLLGRPVSILSLLFTGIVHGPTPWGYKYHNLLIHLLNGLLLFWLFLKLLPRLSPTQSAERILAVSGLSATIWLLHPLMVSTVLYAVQRMAQLSTLFSLAALLVYVEARESANTSGLKFYLLAYIGFPLFLALSIFSKENGALIPIFVFAIEYIVYRFAFTSALVKRRTLCFQTIFVFIPVTVGTLVLFTHLSSFTNYSVRNFTMGERLLTQLHVVATYLKMILLPRLSDMTLFHDYVEVVRGFDLETVILFACFLLSVFLVFYLRLRAPVAAFAIAWFLVSHLLESTFFSLELMFEHRNYMAAAGPLLALVYYLFNVPDYPFLKYINGLFLILVVLLTIVRVQEWTSVEMIYEIALEEHPDSTRVQSQMANMKFNRGDFEGAMEHLAMAQKNSPTEFGPVLHEVIYRCGTGSDIQPLIDESITRARNYPVTAYSLNSLDRMLALLNENKCPEMDLDKLHNIVVAAKNQDSNKNFNQSLGYLENIEGQIYLLKGDFPKAIEFSLKAYENTGRTTILSNLAVNMIQLKLLDDAEQIIRILKNINVESKGKETSLIKPLEDKLAEARLAISAQDNPVEQNEE